MPQRERERSRQGLHRKRRIHSCGGNGSARDKVWFPQMRTGGGQRRLDKQAIAPLHVPWTRWDFGELHEENPPCGVWARADWTDDISQDQGALSIWVPDYCSIRGFHLISIIESFDWINRTGLRGILSIGSEHVAEANEARLLELRLAHQLIKFGQVLPDFVGILVQSLHLLKYAQKNWYLAL